MRPLDIATVRSHTLSTLMLHGGYILLSLPFCFLAFFSSAIAAGEEEKQGGGGEDFSGGAHRIKTKQSMLITTPVTICKNSLGRTTAETLEEGILEEETLEAETLEAEEISDFESQ